MLGVKVSEKSYIISRLVRPLMKVGVTVKPNAFIFTGVACRLMTASGPWGELARLTGDCFRSGKTEFCSIPPAPRVKDAAPGKGCPVLICRRR